MGSSQFFDIIASTFCWKDAVPGSRGPRPGEALQMARSEEWDNNHSHITSNNSGWEWLHIPCYYTTLHHFKQSATSKLLSSLNNWGLTNKSRHSWMNEWLRVFGSKLFNFLFKWLRWNFINFWGCLDAGAQIILIKQFTIGRIIIHINKERKRTKSIMWEN